MKGLIAFAASLLAQPLLAGVVSCDLHPEDPETVAGTLRVYELDGFVHSILVELETSYGDVLPYLFGDTDGFGCMRQCGMDLQGDDYTYGVSIFPNAIQPDSLMLVTRSRADDNQRVERFEVVHCRNAR